MVGSCADTLGYILTGFLFEFFGMRKSLVYCYSISAFFILVLILMYNSVEYVPYALLGCKFGIAAAFNVMFIISTTLFPN